MAAVLEKVKSVCLRAVFRKNCRQILNEFVSTILSTVAARSLVGEGGSCLSPVILVGGDNYSAFYLFGQPIDVFLNFGWVKGSDIEAAKAEFHSFVCEQRQIEQSSNLRVPITALFFFRCGQPGCCSRRQLYRVSILLKFSFLTIGILRCNTFYVLSFQCDCIPVLVILMFVFPDLPAVGTRGQGSRGFA